MPEHRRRFVPCRLLAVAILIASGIATQTLQARDAQVATGERGMVVTVSPPATKIGVAVLKRGGNAVDAAVAVALTMAVTWPEAGNIGGGGFMMVFPGGKAEPVCIEYRERAPAAAKENMFSLKDSRWGHRIVGVPGTVRGLALAHRRFGKLTWKELVMPAVRLAGKGFAVEEGLAKSLNRVLRHKGTQNFAELLRVFAPPNGKAWKAGDRLVQKDLAGTLRQIAERGPDAFYRGKIAEQIAAEMRAGKGLITRKDLAGYQAKIRKPVHGTFRGYDIYGPPPPSSGGTALVQMLNILENFDLQKQGRWSPETLHLMIEAMRRAYLDRARHLGDADFVNIPPHLTTKKYAAKLAGQIDRRRATRSEDLAKDIPIAGEGDSTTHFSVIDASGMAVSNTYTLEHSFGSRVVVRGAGFLLNNEMGDFNWKLGYTDRRGTIGTRPNRIQPGKRMLSSQCPTIVAKGGKAVLITGSPGGRTIINTVLNVVLNTIEFKMPLKAAVEAPRLHHQWLPDLVRFEGRADDRFKATLHKLGAMGHKFQTKLYLQGDAHSIWIAPNGRFIGVADSRRNGRAMGY